MQIKNRPQTRSLIIARAQWGGFALAPYILYDDEATFQRQWRLNPFLFFAKAFDLQQMPKPDVTTLASSRLWFSHIDGDALVSKSEIGKGFSCGEMVRDSILQKYNLPVSVSIVVAELLQKKKFIKIARSIFALNNVEAASHSYSHPFYWDENYEHKNEYRIQHLAIPGYVFNVKTEVAGSVEFINRNLAPAGKPVKAFFWSGNCQPTGQAIQYCDEAGLPNMNGGDTVFDNRHPSYTNVAPLTVPVGDRLQFYAANANENIYTEEWSGPYFGFLNVLKTFAYTESPRRIRPVDVYYHFYSAEKRASLQALKTVIEKSVEAIVAPVFASEYLRIVQGFFSMQIRRVDELQWEISKGGACKTIRFDNCSLQVDLGKSLNVIGYSHNQEMLYIHLGAADLSRVVLTSKADNCVYLHQATHQPVNLEMAAGKIRFSARGYGSGFFEFYNLPQQQEYIARINGEPEKAETDDLGILQINCEITGEVDIEITRVD